MAIELRLSRKFLKGIEASSDDERGRLESALQSLQSQWGNPHAHSGLSIRRLTHNYYECRAGMDLRIVFMADPLLLTLFFAGNHDDVRRYLRQF